MIADLSETGTPAYQEWVPDMFFPVMGRFRLLILSFTWHILCLPTLLEEE